jgi:hypothetical protein
MFVIALWCNVIYYFASADKLAVASVCESSRSGGEEYEYGYCRDSEDYDDNRDGSDFDLCAAIQTLMWRLLRLRINALARFVDFA